jgi:hypothetical protein
VWGLLEAGLGQQQPTDGHWLHGGHEHLGDRAGIHQLRQSERQCRDGADDAHNLRTIKEELLWVREFRTLEEAREAIRHSVTVDYNQQYVLESLGYKSRCEFERTWAAQGQQAA